MILKYSLKNGDPFGINNKEYSKSTALNITLEGDDIKKPPYNRKNGVILFHHFESCLNFIMSNGFLILDIKVTITTIRIIVYKTNYILKRIQKCSDAVKLLKPYVDEFKPKFSWKGLNIADMGEHGFNTGIWIAYGYYDADRLIAVCDYKIRLDQDIEVGIMCVDKDYRGEELAKSLLYFFRLKFFSSRLFSGTYNGNDNMIRAFIGTGFTPVIFHNVEDENVINGTNIIYDRVNKEKFYSVYYTANPLWKVQDHFVH